MEDILKVFLSHNGEDKPVVRLIAEKLKQKGIPVWFDEWELQPGMPWQEGLEQGLEKSLAIVVFIGPGSFGKWETPEMRVALELQVQNQRPVIPALLPGVPEDVEKQMPLFLRRHTWVDFRAGVGDEKALKRLLWGVTGKNPEEKPPPPPPFFPPGGTNQVDDAIRNLNQTLLSGNLTYFIGSGASNGIADLPPRACDIARMLLLELQLIDHQHDKLLPPVDIAGMYYAMRVGDRNLEDKVCDLIMRQSRTVPPLHENLARLLNQLAATRPTRRMRRRTPQLIVTTSLDVMMERALLRAGISFTRIVQHRSQRRIEINEYRDVQRLDANTIQLPSVPGVHSAPVKVRLNQFDELDDIIATYGQRYIEQGSDEVPTETINVLHTLSLQGMPEPILYKFLGSQDVPDSCAISTDHYFQVARRILRRNCIPAQISEIIANTPVLFFGYGFLDPDFRLTYYTLLRKPFELATEQRYALQLPPDRFANDIYRRMETGLWENIKRAGQLQLGIATLEEDGEVFLRKLLESLQTELAA